MGTELIHAELIHAALTATAAAVGWTGPNRLVEAVAPGGGVASEDVSPGVIGFLVTLALVLACIPLFRSMTGKLRGVQHRSTPESDPAESDPAESDPVESGPSGGDPAGGDPAESDPAGGGRAGGDPAESDPAGGGRAGGDRAGGERAIGTAPSPSPATPDPSGEQTG